MEEYGYHDADEEERREIDERILLEQIPMWSPQPNDEAAPPPVHEPAPPPVHEVAPPPVHEAGPPLVYEAVPQPDCVPAPPPDHFAKFGDAILSEFNCKKGKKRTAAYNNDIKQFSLTMYGHSPKGYKYLRRCLNDSLPSVRSLRNYYIKIDASPGLTMNSLEILKQRVLEIQTKSQEL